MRNVLGRVSAGAARGIFDFVNPRDKSLTVSCVRCSVDERGHSERDEGAQVSQWKSSKLVCQRI